MRLRTERLPGVLAALMVYWLVEVHYAGGRSVRHIYITDGFRPTDGVVVAGPFTDANDLINALTQ